MNKRRHPRFIKRLTAKFFTDQKSATGILSDLSESGLFIRTKRGFAVDTPIGIELLLPNNKVSLLKGIVRRSTGTPISAMKNGMGIEITEKDETFVDFAGSIFGKQETNIMGKDDAPELQIMSFASREAAKKDSRNTTQDKRRNKRFKVKHMKVDSKMLSASQVKIIDISMSGVLMKVDKRLNIGRKYAVNIGYRDKVLFVEADVVWSLLVDSHKDADGDIKPIYLAGMQFTDVSRAKIKEIVKCIEFDTEAEKNQLNNLGARHAEFIHSDNAELSKGYSVKKQGDIASARETESSAEFMKGIEGIYGRHEQKILTYYGILDICDFANTDEIRKAYYKKAKELHPDRHFYLSPEMKEKLNFLFTYLTEAYKTLRNPGDKEKYDKCLLAKNRVPVSGQELAHQEFEQGKLEFWNGNFLEAERFLQKAVSLDNYSGKYFYFYAKTLFKLGKLREAEKAIRKALNIDPLSPDYLIEAGYIYRALGLSHRARKSFETALRFQPSNIKAHEGIEGLEGKAFKKMA